MEAWVKVLIDIPEKQSLPPGTARKLVAKALNDHPQGEFPLEILHYTEAEDGPRPTGGLSPFRFGGKPGQVQIAAIGDTASDLLNANAHRITIALGRHFGTPLRERRLNGKFQIRTRPFLTPYRISQLILHQNAKEYQSIAADAKAHTVTPAVLELARRKILTGLQRQARYLGVDLPDEALVLGDVAIEGWRDSFYVPILVRPGLYFLAANEVTFRTNLDLTNGPWHVGHLNSRGFGRIDRLGGSR